MADYDPITVLAKLRRALYDNPVAVQSAATLTADATVTTLTLKTGDGAKLGQAAGQVLESDDYQTNVTTEQLLIESVVGDTVTVVRAFEDPNTLLDHASGIFYRLSPRFTIQRCIDAVDEILSTHLWPWVWTPKRTTMAYQSAVEWFLPTATDIQEVTRVYQRVSGVRYNITDWEWLPPDDTDPDWPNGALIVPWGTIVDAASTLYVDYKALPPLNLLGSTLPARLGELVILGAKSILVGEEETARVAPDRSANQNRVAEGSKMRTGAYYWSRFTEKRDQENARLQAETPSGYVMGV